MVGVGREHPGDPLAAVWFAAVAAGFVVWERYDTTPGEVRTAEPNAVPPAGRWRLVMFAHPHCPCTRASLVELAELIEQTPVEAEVVFVRPVDCPDGWERTAAWAAAAAIPGVQARCDVGGVEARRAGAATSGHVVLTGPDGRVVFGGGITPGRGRRGDSTGRRMISDRLTGRAVGFGSAPVFGCPLFSPGACVGEECVR